jgi:Protein of unknown function (DUF1822)
MTNSSLEPTDIETIETDFDDWQSVCISLSPPDLDWAVQMGQAAAGDDEQQWQTFLRAMALAGFRQWLSERPVALPVVCDRRQPPPLAIPCQVNRFRLALLTQGSLSDELVQLPQAALTPPAAHFYVLIEVLEEFDQVRVLGALRQDRLRAYQLQTPLTLNAEATYSLPLQLFDTQPEQLLLYLSQLEPAAIESSEIAAPAPAVQPAASRLRRPSLINAGRWLQEQLDAAAESLSWMLLSPLTLASATAMRSSTEALEDALNELAPTGVTIPSRARGVSIDGQRQGFPGQVYALTWPVYESSLPEWALFLCLGPAANESLPAGIRLTVEDEHGVLAEQSLASESASAYLYAQVFGRWDESFTAVITLPDGSAVPLATFVFEPEQ